MMCLLACWYMHSPSSNSGCWCVQQLSPYCPTPFPPLLPVPPSLLQYKLSLAEELQLEPTGSSSSTGSTEAAVGAASGAGAGPSSSARRDFNRLSSWGEEAAAEAVAAAAAQRRQHQQRLAAQQQSSGLQGDGQQGQLAELQELGLDCFAELQYQARVKGFMQPRRYGTAARLLLAPRSALSAALQTTPADTPCRRR